jgi:hypothetical protein
VEDNLGLWAKMPEAAERNQKAVRMDNMVTWIPSEDGYAFQNNEIMPSFIAKNR